MFASSQQGSVEQSISQLKGIAKIPVHSDFCFFDISVSSNRNINNFWLFLGIDTKIWIQFEEPDLSQICLQHSLRYNKIATHLPTLFIVRYPISSKIFVAVDHTNHKEICDKKSFRCSTIQNTKHKLPFAIYLWNN